MEASEAMETASYERGVLETETWLAEEVAGVFRDYCAETWAKVLNRARVLANSELRRVENIFFSEDIREVTTKLPPSIADPLPPLQQLPQPKPLLLMLKSQQGLERVRRFSY